MTDMTHVENLIIVLVFMVGWLGILLTGAAIYHAGCWIIEKTRRRPRPMATLK